MNKTEQRLLIKIAETVGELFEDLRNNPKKSEITFDQNVCAELWNDYDAWVRYLKKENK